MSCVDLVGSEANGTYNRKLAKLTDLYVAVYWGEIVEIASKVVRKKKYTEEGYFQVDREYIAEKTTISIEDQLNCDSILSDIGVLANFPGDTNTIKVDIKKMVEIIISNEIKEVSFDKKKKKRTNTEKATIKKNGIIITMKNCISEFEADEELIKLYEGWVDSVYATKRFTTKVIIQNMVNAINTNAKRKQDKIDMLGIAIRTGYTEPQWIIEMFNNPKQRSNIQYNKSIADAEKIDLEKTATLNKNNEF